MAEFCRRCTHGAEWIDANGVCQYGVDVPPLYRACGCTHMKRLDPIAEAFETLREAMRVFSATVDQAFEKFRDSMKGTRVEAAPAKSRRMRRTRKSETQINALEMPALKFTPTQVSALEKLSTPSGLPDGERRILIVIAERGKQGCSREYVSVVTGFKRSTRDTYISRLMGKGFVVAPHRLLLATDEGRTALGNFKPLPKGGKALREHWLKKLPEGEGLILELLTQHPDGLARDVIGEYTRFKRSTRDTYISRLRTRYLIEDNGDGGFRLATSLR